MALAGEEGSGRCRSGARHFRRAQGIARARDIPLLRLIQRSRPRSIPLGGSPHCHRRGNPGFVFRHRVHDGCRKRRTTIARPAAIKTTGRTRPSHIFERVSANKPTARPTIADPRTSGRRGPTMSPSGPRFATQAQRQGQSAKKQSSFRDAIATPRNEVEGKEKQDGAERAVKEKREQMHRQIPGSGRVEVAAAVEEPAFPSSKKAPNRERPDQSSLLRARTAACLPRLS